MSAWSKLLDSLSDVAPTLAGAAATAVTGGNPAAGAVVASLVRQATGRGHDDADLDGMAAECLGDPVKLMALRQQARQLELEELRLRTLDVQDARKHQSLGTWVISGLVVAGFLIAVALVMTVDIPQGAGPVAYLLVGTLAAGFTQVLNFFLGSSMGSKEKDATMARYAETAKAAQAGRNVARG